MPDPWTTPGRPHATRSICPLCDWYYDESVEVPFVGALGYELAAMQAETVIRAHLETHSLEEWAKAATALQQLQHFERKGRADA